MITGLPPDSALARARNKGREWTTTHALLWQILHVLVRANVLLLDIRNRKQKPKFPKWKEFPWSDDDKKSWGRVKKGDEKAAVDYLLSLHKRK